MLPKLKKLTSILLCFLLVLQQTGFSQTIDLSGYFSQLSRPLSSGKFRPLHLRCISYDIQENSFRLRLDKGSLKNPSPEELENSSKTLFNYFLIGLALPNDSFWVNLRPDSPDNIIDDSLARTDIGKIMLETDLQLKKDTAQSTSPNTPQGKAYWDKLYQKAEELYGSANITIPTLTRPWIVPGEIIIGETSDSAYVYKATLKVMLEEDYLEKSEIRNPKSETNSNSKIQNSKLYEFKDPRLKELNEYSTQLIKETIIPKLTQEINSSQKYAKLRQIYYSLILAQWFKTRFSREAGSRNQINDMEGRGKSGRYLEMIDKKDLTGLTSTAPWSKTTYFEEYKRSFKDGEYSLKEPRYTPSGQTIKSYFSGGEYLFPTTASVVTIIPAKTLPITSSAISENIIPTASSSLIDINLSPAETKKLANELAENLGLHPPDYLIDKFTVSGKTFEFWSNINMTCFIVGPLVLIPLIDEDLFYPGGSKHNLNGFDVRKMVEVIVKDKLIKKTGKLYLNNRSNVLLVSPFSAVQKQPINPYSALMIAGMLAAADSFKGATIIDAGSGAGLLSLVALGLGAENAVLIESDDMELRLAKAILETQRYEEGKNFIRIKENLEIKPKKLIDRLKNTDLTLDLKRLIGLANIGPWPWYGKANHKAIELFIKLGVIQIFNGGYSSNFDTRKEILIHLNELDEVETLLKPFYNVQKVLTPTGYGFISAVSKTMQLLQTNESRTGDTPTPPENSSSAVGFGGIDFRNLPIVTQARNNLSANIAGSAIVRLNNIDLDREWMDIQNITGSGITPSPERIKEYLQGLYLKDDYSQEKAQNVILCLADILRLEEENYLATDALLKDILIVLSSTDNTPELKEAFLGKAVK